MHSAQLVFQIYASVSCVLANISHKSRVEVIGVELMAPVVKSIAAQLEVVWPPLICHSTH